MKTSNKPRIQPTIPPRGRLGILIITVALLHLSWTIPALGLELEWESDSTANANPSDDGTHPLEVPEPSEPAIDGSGDDATQSAEAHTADNPLAIFPVEGPSHFNDSWGAPRSGGRVHMGIDIFAEKMTPVVAVAPGIVVAAGVSDDKAGVYVKVAHDDGGHSFYVHLNNDTPGTDDGMVVGIAEGIAPGSRVEAGTLLGWVGDSGNAEGTPSHLHFEYHMPDLGAVNPYLMLRGTQGQGVTLAIEILPFTGSESHQLAGIALALLAAGSIALVAHNRIIAANDDAGRETL